MENSTNNNEPTLPKDIFKNSKKKKLVTAVGADSTNYNMNHKKQGFAYIFIQENLDNSKQRKDMNTDAEKLKKCLVTLGFDVHCFKNLKVAEIEQHVRQVNEMDHRNNNCILMAVLTHGDNIQSIAAYDRPYDPNEIFWQNFTAEQCLTLAGKPKLFFIQCYQGDDPEIDFGQKGYQIETDGGKSYTKYRIPVNGDVCIMFSTTGDFIRALSEELTEHADREHLLTILTFVIGRIAPEFHNLELCMEEQLCYVESSLTRIVQFINKVKE